MDKPFTYNDVELLRQISQGNEVAFRQLFHTYQRRLYTYVYKVTGSHEVTEDIVQDIFLAIWAMREKLPGIANINAYLHKSAHHAAYKSLQEIAKEELVVHYLQSKSAHPAHSASSHVFNQLLSKEIRQQIQQLVDQLTPRQREVFLLSREHGLKYEEIALRLGIGYESVKSHLADALKFLRNELRQQYGPNAVALYVIYQLGNL